MNLLDLLACSPDKLSLTAPTSHCMSALNISTPDKTYVEQARVDELCD